MFQTLPLVMGALTLLADSFMEPAAQSTSTLHQDLSAQQFKDEVDAADAPGESAPDPDSKSPDTAASAEVGLQEDRGPEALHAQAYNLYTLFRPDTGGEWGKRARFELNRVLDLRAGRTAAGQITATEAGRDEAETKEGLQSSPGGIEEEGDGQVLEDEEPRAVKAEQDLEDPEGNAVEPLPTTDASIKKEE